MRSFAAIPNRSFSGASTLSRCRFGGKDRIVMSMKRILVIQPLRREGLEVFAGRKDVAYKVVTNFSEENLLANVGDADAIAVRTAVITKRVLDAAPRLKVISRHGVGYDNIPVSECTAR